MWTPSQWAPCRRLYDHGCMEHSALTISASQPSCIWERQSASCLGATLESRITNSKPTMREAWQQIESTPVDSLSWNKKAGCRHVWTQLETCTTQVSCQPCTKKTVVVFFRNTEETVVVEVEVGGQKGKKIKTISFIHSFLYPANVYYDQCTAGHTDLSKQRTRFPFPETLHVGRVDRQLITINNIP